MESHILKWTRGVERGVLYALMLLIGLALILSTAELAWIAIVKIKEPPVGLLDLPELLEFFGFFLMVLIGIELLHSIRAYLTERRNQAEVVLLVALIAAARKVIVLDLDKLSPMTLVSVSAVILALAVAYLLVRKAGAARSAMPET